MPGSQSESNSGQPNIKELITFAEAARLSGFTDRHLRKLASQNKLWSIKLGRNWFTTAQAVKDYLETEHKPGPKPLKADK
jgi:excisionase family DNA binding protein